MQNPTARAQDIPQTMAVESILDMDPGELANEFKDFSFTPPLEKIIYASSNSDPLQINFETLSSLGRDQTVREIESVKKAFYSLATSVQKSKINEIEVTTKAIPVKVERLYEELNREIKNILSQPKYETSLNTDPLAQIFIDKKNTDSDKEELKAIEALATNKNKKNIDKAKLLIYGQLIDKIEEIDSHQIKEIKEIYDKILYLKFKEVTLKKFLPPKEKTPAKIDVKPLFAEMPLSGTPIISQPPVQSPLSILLQTPSFDNDQKIKLDKLRDMPAESIFPIKESDPQPDSQSSGAPPLPLEVAKLAMVFAENNFVRQALKASQAEVIKESRRLESERNQLTLELLQLEKINHQGPAVSFNTNLEEIIAREEELKRVLEEKQRQEDITRIEAWRIQQELTIQEALNRKQDGEIPGLRPGQKPEIGTYQNQLKGGIENIPFPHSPSGIKENISAVPWDQKYLANLRGDKQQKAPSPPLFQGLYPPFQTLGAGSFALGAMQPQAPVQDLSSSNQPLAPTQTSLQNLQANANNDQVVASPRNFPAGTSAIFTRKSNDENLVTNENLESRSPPSDTKLDKLFQTLSATEATPLSANQLLGGLQSKLQDQDVLISPSEFQSTIPELQQNNSEFIVSTSIKETRGELGLSAQQSDVPPPPSRDENSSRVEFQASSIIPSLKLDELAENIPQTIPREQEEKKQFWQTFISTKLRERPSNFNQNSPRNNEDNSNQDQLDTRPQSSSPPLEFNTVLIFPYSTIQPTKIDEIEERKRKLYTILKINLEKQSTTKSESDSKYEEENKEEENKAEMNAENAKTTIETVMEYIATCTSDLASSISKVENKQTEGAHQSEASDSQMIQNSSNEDPIIYSGIGIRIKLEKEGENHSLKITEVFKNSGIDQGDVNKKITHVKYEGKLKSISAIYGDCGGDEEKFYTKIALIFRDEKQEELTLKIDDEEKTVGKNIFIPEDKTVLNVTKNSQMTKIAEKLREQRQTFSQLSPRNLLAQTA